MNTIRPLTDKLAISLSILCTLHCLLLPLVVAFLPIVSTTFITQEYIHAYMVFAVIPISFYAVTLGCRQHRRFSVLVTASIGLFTLVLAVLMGHEWLGELGEKGLTLIGASLLALGHWQNYQLCLHDEGCDCTHQ